MGVSYLGHRCSLIKVLSSLRFARSIGFVVARLRFVLCLRAFMVAADTDLNYRVSYAYSHYNYTQDHILLSMGIFI